MGNSPLGMTLFGIAGVVIIANLLTVVLVWGCREFARARREHRPTAPWTWFAILGPLLLAAGAAQAAFLAAFG